MVYLPSVLNYTAFIKGNKYFLYVYTQMVTYISSMTYNFEYLYMQLKSQAYCSITIVS